MMETIARRQYVNDDDGNDIWFWYTTPGIIIKYVVFLTILLLLFAWIVGGRVHAKRRLMRGQKPLGYHAWLLSRRERALVDPAYRWPHDTYYGVYRPGYHGHPSANDNNNNHPESYGMHAMPPPPMYDPTRPPMYEGPPPPPAVGAPNAAPGTKGGEQQHRGQGGSGAGASNGGHEEEFAPPAGPPPAVYR
ncbi:hypothetical protein F5Y17DRAFT_419337 [Xylariaceae sp. FL0594]|nr:hypothetical protein F5Y17DRAFT_419337 [Xylariaceae sp. FL0594]